MLIHASRVRSQIEEAHQVFADSPRARSYLSTSWGRTPDITAEDWTRICRASVSYPDGAKEPRLHGYLYASVERDARGITSLGVIRFDGGSPLVFGRDLRTFMGELVASFEVVRWVCIAGSPNEALYDHAIRLLEREGVQARRAGLAWRYFRLPTGELADAVFYEAIGKGGRG